MSMLDALMQAGGAQAISRELGVDQRTAQSGLEALLPAVLGGMQNHAQGPQGLGGLAGLLGSLGGAGMLSNVLSPEPTDVLQGNQLLGNLFGSKDTSRAIADQASRQTNLPPSLLKKMLPIVAMLAAGYFAKHAQSQQEGSGGASGGGIGGMLGSLLGAGGGSNPFGSILSGLVR